jgi:hypothetical protein
MFRITLLDGSVKELTNRAVLRRGTIMKLLTGEVSIGDRFTKVGDYSRTVYIVNSIVESRGAPPHVRLVGAGGRESMLMSASALLDAHFWLRVSLERD